MTEKEAKTTEEAWRDVGKQFEALGTSLAEAFRAAWESEETRSHVRKMQEGLETMADKVEQTVEEASASEEAQKLRGEAEKAAESLRVASEKTWQETRPQLLSALSQFNAELQKLIERLERQETGPDMTSDAPPDAPEGEEA